MFVPIMPQDLRNVSHFQTSSTRSLPHEIPTGFRCTAVLESLTLIIAPRLQTHKSSFLQMTTSGAA